MQSIGPTEERFPNRQVEFIGTEANPSSTSAWQFREQQDRFPDFDPEQLERRGDAR
jgi:hypothetical protein